MTRFLLPLIFPALACAQEVSTGALEHMTRASEESRGIAYGYFVGVAESTDSRQVCLPPGVSLQDAIARVSEGLDRAPPGLPAAKWITLQLTVFYPCK